MRKQLLLFLAIISLVFAAPSLTTPSSGGVPAGNDTEIQFNNAGSFGGNPNFVFDSTTETLTLTNANVTGSMIIGDISYPTAFSGGYKVLASNGAGDGLSFSYINNLNPAANKSSDYEITNTDGYVYIMATSGAGNVVITLPSADDNPQRIISIKKIDSGAGDIIVSANYVGELIDAAATLTLADQYDTVNLIAYNSNWNILSSLGL